MTYAQLVNWAAELGKTEQQLIYYFAHADAYCIIDDADAHDLAETLMNGIHIDAKYVQDYWEGLDDETQKETLGYIRDFWVPDP